MLCATWNVTFGCKSRRARFNSYFTLLSAGHDNPDSSVGIYACDPEAYTTFSDVLDPVIKDYHKVEGDIAHPTPTFGDLANLSFGDLDPENAQVVSTRVRVGRSLAGYPFPPVISKEVRFQKCSFYDT
jgi:creatine kinase